jgi:hypothetical protein
MDSNWFSLWGSTIMFTKSLQKNLLAKVKGYELIIFKWKYELKLKNSMDMKIRSWKCIMIDWEEMLEFP